MGFFDYEEENASADISSSATETSVPSSVHYMLMLTTRSCKSSFGKVSKYVKESVRTVSDWKAERPTRQNLKSSFESMLILRHMFRHRRSFTYAIGVDL